MEPPQVEWGARIGIIMKKLLFALLIVLTVLLSACSTAATGTATNSTDNDLPIVTQLAVGTLELAESGPDVTAEQAEELVLYWQVYKELGQSETAAQAEKDGLVAQIQETMTDAQIQAITDMALTQHDVFTALQGVAMVSSSSGDSTVSAPSGGDIPAGGPFAGDGSAPLEGGIAMEVSGAAPAMDQAQSSQPVTGLTAATAVPSTLIDAVLESLGEKTAT
jgi:hypothetical protein